LTPEEEGDSRRKNVTQSVARDLITSRPGRDRQSKLPLEITITKFTCGAVRLILIGDLDLFGAEKLDLPLATLAGAGGDVVVDMTRLRNIASIGIRHLVSAAGTLGRRRGRLILLDPSPVVTNMLMNTRVDNLLLIVRTEDEVQLMLGSPTMNQKHWVLSHQG
jgi:anti-anti-sigma factor